MEVAIADGNCPLTLLYTLDGQPVRHALTEVQFALIEAGNHNDFNYAHL